MKVNECRICKSQTLDVILEYGEVALADAFLDDLNQVKEEKKYPLNLCMCDSCKHLQIDETMDPKLHFRNCVYETGVSPSVISYTQQLTEILLKRYGSSENPRVLEIASNDGTGLSFFKEKGCDILGIDPAENIVEGANKKGIRSIAKFFNLESAQEIVEEYGCWEIIIARNVMAHVSDIHGLAGGIKLTLSERGFASIEVPHLQTMFEQLQYDQVIHEHIGYHSLDSFQKLFSQYEIEVFDVEKVWVQGGSIRVYLQHNNGPRKISNQVSELIKEESELGLYDRASWNIFSERILLHKTALKNEIIKLRGKEKKVSVYGASGKGQSLLQFCELDHNLLDYVVDKSKLKQGKFTPGTHIPIYSNDHIYKELPDIILLCAWNFSDEIIKQEEHFVELGGRFLHPLPMPHYLS